MTMKLIKKQNLNKKKRGAALVEYGLLVAGVALTTAVAVSMLGHKTNDLLGTVAGALPSSNEADTGAIQSGRLFATQSNGGVITLDIGNEDYNTTDEIFGQGAGNLIFDPTQ
ncbi:MAG: Flp pilus assembly pilin Flp [Planctomycetota bacterium]|jgi:Flp pilus assembly pilin Flp